MYIYVIYQNFTNTSYVIHAFKSKDKCLKKLNELEKSSSAQYGVYEYDKVKLEE